MSDSPRAHSTLMSLTWIRSRPSLPAIRNAKWSVVLVVTAFRSQELFAGKMRPSYSAPLKQVGSVGVGCKGLTADFAILSRNICQCAPANWWIQLLSRVTGLHCSRCDARWPRYRRLAMSWTRPRLIAERPRLARVPIAMCPLCGLDHRIFLRVGRC
jgi:hypothetical protein